MIAVVYLLDTNAISDLMRSGSRIEGWLSSATETDRMVTCAIVRGEILFGIAKLADGRRRSDLAEKARRLFDTMPCEPIPENAGDHYAAIKLGRQRLGLSLDENDLWIAATALALGATLVTRDRDFSGIQGLLVLAVA